MLDQNWVWLDHAGPKRAMKRPLLDFINHWTFAQPKVCHSGQLLKSFVQYSMGFKKWQPWSKNDIKGSVTFLCETFFIKWVLNSGTLYHKTWHFTLALQISGILKFAFLFSVLKRFNCDHVRHCSIKCSLTNFTSNRRNTFLETFSYQIWKNFRFDIKAFIAITISKSRLKFSHSAFFRDRIPKWTMLKKVLKSIILFFKWWNICARIVFHRSRWNFKKKINEKKIRGKFI